MIRSHQKIRKTKISLKDFILLISSKLIDIYFDFKDPFNLISNYYRFINEDYKSLNLNKDQNKKIIKKYNNTIYILKKQGYLRKNTNPNKINFHLTNKTKSYLKTKYPALYFNKKNWDKKIRLIIFDIFEINRVKRNQLRKILKKIGFIMIQKSVWLCLYDQIDIVKQWLKENNLQEKILIIETEKSNIKFANKIIDKFWINK